MSDEQSVHLDEQGSLARVGQDHELLCELYEAFSQDAPLKLASLEGAVRNADISGIVESAHSLKGASAAIGAEHCRGLAESLEMAGHAEDLAQAPELFRLVSSEVALVLSLVSERIAAYSSQA